jgi:hypothetical protein
MNWYKKTQLTEYAEIKDYLEKILGLGKYAPSEEELLKIKKERKNNNSCDCQHSLDIHCDGGDDGY